MLSCHRNAAHNPATDLPDITRNLTHFPRSKLFFHSDAEVLSMFAMIINRLRGKMEAEVRG